MFAVTFDDFQRRMAAKAVEDYPWTIVKLETCLVGTEAYKAWTTLWLEEGSDIHIHVEPEGGVVTFFRIGARKPVVL